MADLQQKGNNQSKDTTTKPNSPSSGNNKNSDNKKAPFPMQQDKEKPKDFMEQLKTAPQDEQIAYGCIFLGAFLLLVGVILLFVM